MRVLFLVILACFYTHNVYATGLKGDYLLKACQIADEYLDDKVPRLGSDGAWCLGYITGFTQAHLASLNALIKNKSLQNQIHPSGIIYCLTDDITYHSQIKAIVEYLLDDDKALKQPVHDIVLAALQKSYPCDDAATKASESKSSTSKNNHKKVN